VKSIQGEAMFDLVISNGLVYYNGGLQTLDLGISKGKVAALGTPGSLLEPKEILDAKRSWVLPGFIDSHVHLRYPAQQDFEDLITGTGLRRSHPVEMPISSPSVHNGDILTEGPLFEKEY
jgi:imidazolonepropionase-like amidohydrolase